MKPVGVGVIGCGHISPIYFQNMKKWEILNLRSCADIVPERAVQRAEEYGIRASSNEEVLNDPEIEIVVNLTVPNAHAEISLAALERGKHVHSEKPLATRREDGAKILKAAKDKGLLVGCAPDTFMGSAVQTCKKLMDDGWIGEPVAATVFMMYHGPEFFHPDPGFFYRPGGGPLMDMGPYYITALVNLMGPVVRVTGMARKSFEERTITSQPLFGQKIKVEIPTHIAGTLEFQNGAIATIVTSFDIWEPYGPWVEVHGSLGSMRVPDPNNWTGSVEVRLAGETAYQPVPLTHIYRENSRGIGVADMAYSIRTGRKHRANGDLAYHVLEVMTAILEASATGSHQKIQSTVMPPAPMPRNLPAGVLD